MANCQDCLQNCPQVYSDRCIQYTGAANTNLSICTGDSLFEIEESLINYTSSLIDNGGILTLSALALCTFVSDILGDNSPTLTNVINSLATGECSLNTRLLAVEAVVNAPYSFDTQCLTGDLTSVNKIIQALIIQGCSTFASVEAIEADYVKESELCDKVAACLANTTSQYNTRMVPGIIYPYIGSLSNFDNTGKGIEGAGFKDVYLVNGLNGTPDWRGRSPIGAVNNVPGGTLDSTVDPSLPANTGTNYTLGQKVGSSFNTLSIPQIPAHTHGISDPGHMHIVQHSSIPSGSTGALGGGLGVLDGVIQTNTALTNILINSTGGGFPVNNRQPSIACYYIIYIIS